MPLGSSARFEGAHHRELDRIGAFGELRRFQPADAVFGADAAAEALDQIEHGRLELCAALEKRRRRRARRSGSR